ncbi:MAG TPA: cupredoxin domain-containing protein [Usitatibacter sp.]|jgi:cytochrome c oxidase subunit 2|nr:cupredoxin domain-containing protein [Usitatibacter sp.]
MDARRRHVLAGAVALAAAAAGVRAAAEPRVIKVVARKFVFLPREIALKVGEPVTLELTAPEVVMGFNAPDFKVRTDIIPGTPARVTFTPDKAGSFTFLCDVFCGDGHEGMSGTLVVT